MTDQLHLFGKPRLVTVAGAQVRLSASAWRLVAAVAAGPAEGVARGVLARLVLPAGRRSTLRKLIHDIGRAEARDGFRLLDSDKTSLRLAPDLYCDVRDLLSAAPERDLFAIYAGPFLDVVHDVDHELWADWLAEQRDRLQRVYLAKADAKLADPDRFRVSQVREAVRLLELQPDNEAAVRTQMLADAEAKDLERVERAYRGLRARLSAGGARPEDRTTDLYLRLTGALMGREGPADRAQDAGVPTICMLKPTGPEDSPARKLAESLVVDVAIGLCRLNTVKVLAPETAWQMACATDLAAIEGLRVSYVVTTGLIDHATEGRCVVFLLHHLPTRRILWSDRIDAAEGWSILLYNILTSQILRGIVSRIEDAEVDAFTLRADPSSYVLYLRGQPSLTSLDLKSLRGGRQHLQRAFAQSPGFAPAASSLARSFQLEWVLTARGDPELLERAERYARSAIESDPYEARGFRELGFCALYDKRYDESMRHYERAERLNPNYADLIADSADALVHCGHLPQALDKINRAIDLNPLCQDTYLWTLGAARFFLGDYSEAIRALKRMKDASPAYRLLAAAHALNGDRAAASECRVKAMEIHPTLTIEGWLAIVSLRDQRQIRQYHEGLLSAGFK